MRVGTRAGGGGRRQKGRRKPRSARGRGLRAPPPPPATPPLPPPERALQPCACSGVGVVWWWGRGRGQAGVFSVRRPHHRRAATGWRPVSAPQALGLPPLTGRAVPTDGRADLASIWGAGREGGERGTREERAPTRVKRARSELDTTFFSVPHSRAPTHSLSLPSPTWRPARAPPPPARWPTCAPARGSRRCKPRRTRW